MASHHQGRSVVELDPIDRGEQRDDRERVRDEVRDHSDVGGRAHQGLLLEDLDPDLFDAVEEVAQRPLFCQQELQQPDLELEVVVVRGHDLDPTCGGLQELAVFLRRGAQRLFDQDDVAQVVVELERRQVGGRGSGDVGDDVRARLELALELLVGRRSVAVPIKGVAMRAHFLFLDAEPVVSSRRVLLDHVCAEVEELLQREQVLVCLLAPLAEADQHEILLQVPLFLCHRVQARVLDRDRRLQRKRLSPLHFFWRERAPALALGQDGGADRLAVGDQRQRDQRADSERPHVRRVDLAG